MTPHQSRLSALILCLTMLLPLSSCTKKAQALEPEALSVDSESIPTLNQILDGEDASFVLADTPVSGGGGSRGESKSASDESASQVYSFAYKDLPEGGKSVEAYMLGLTKEEVGFYVVDSEGNEDKPPDFQAEDGTLYLSRTNLRSFSDLSIRLDWNKDQLIMRAWQQGVNTPFAPPEASADWNLIDPKKKDTSKKKDEKTEEPKANEEDKTVILSAQEGVSFLKSLSPAVIGLPGSSMKDYKVYYTEGTAKVDNIVCMRLHVYELGKTAGTNVFLGTYLLATDASRLYRLEAGASTPVEIPLV